MNGLEFGPEECEKIWDALLEKYEFFEDVFFDFQKSVHAKVQNIQGLFESKGMEVLFFMFF